ncbi:MAG: dihydroorotate dehydrogenase, partial [Candidatus Omnitrophica bacterium]|nr:dihydroorotate dehydrogenase [Candidatus Omnitrophota bacterium]
KTVTLNAQAGNPPVRIAETPAGMLNAIGIENPGIDKFIETKLPAFKKIGVPLIISILGHNDKEFKEIARRINKIKGISAVELNLSCPNLKHKTLVAQDPKATSRIVKLVKKELKIPVLAKLSPNVTDISLIAKAAEDAGADGVSLVNTFTAMVIDIEKRKSVLGNFTGGLSGPAIRPIAVYMVHKVYQTVKIPIVAMGGITCAQDALQFMIAGASMVAVGTYNFVNPRATLEVLTGIKDYMKVNKIKDIKKIIGSLK